MYHYHRGYTLIEHDDEWSLLLLLFQHMFILG
jgi:hypothetical protein